MDEVQQLMIKASQFAVDDVDVLNVLGVLFNVSMDYDSALHNFRRAVDLSPDNYSLVNKVSPHKI